MAETQKSYLHDDLADAWRVLKYFKSLPLHHEEDVNERRKQAMDDVKERIKEMQEELDDTD